MPTPRGKGLTGSANGHKPGAEERTLERVRTTQAQKLRKKGRRRAGAMTIEYDLPFGHLLRLAAEARGMGANGYARRAIAAFVAFDLGVPFEEVCANFAPPGKRGEVLQRTDGSRQAPEGTLYDNGEGYGAWRIRSK